MVGRYIMRKMGTLGLLTGTQVFKPSQFRDKVVRVLISSYIDMTSCKYCTISVLGRGRDGGGGVQPDWDLPRGQVWECGGQVSCDWLPRGHVTIYWALIGQAGGGGGALGHHRLHGRPQRQRVWRGGGAGDCPGAGRGRLQPPLLRHLRGLRQGGGGQPGQPRVRQELPRAQVLQWEAAARVPR